MIVKSDLMCDRNVGLQLEAAALNQQLARGQRELGSLAAAHDRLHESYVLRQVGSEKMRKSTEDMLTETFHACASPLAVPGATSSGNTSWSIGCHVHVAQTR